MPGERSEVAQRLAGLARRRATQKRQSDELATEIKATVAEAQHVMPVAEIARHLGLDRSTLYRTYINGNGNGSPA